MAHVFQMMSGTTKQSPITFHGLESARTSEPSHELLELERSLLEKLEVLEVVVPSGRMCSCPVCRSSALVTLAEIADTPPPEDEDGYVVPDVQIGATGIVMPGRQQLARWFRTPVSPKVYKSKLHAKAKIEAKHHSIFTFLSTFSFQTVFFSPCLLTLGTAFFVGAFTGYRSYTVVEKQAQTEDGYIKLETKVRVHAHKARATAWEKLYYCSGCGMVHDREGKRSLPWYSMLQLVHYPEQEFETRAIPSTPDTLEAPAPTIIRTARVA